MATKGRTLAFELGPRRTPASATAEIRSVLEPGAEPPFAGRNGWASVGTELDHVCSYARRKSSREIPDWVSAVRKVDALIVRCPGNVIGVILPSASVRASEM